MKTSQQWHAYFEANLKVQRVDWDQLPTPGERELARVIKSIQAWQLGETSDGAHLLKASKNYSDKKGDSWYVRAVELFIIEEQKHGNNLGRYLDMTGYPRIRSNWGDTLFRRIRYFNGSMEIWTVAVITVESNAQLFYQSLRDATRCPLLREICTDILIDEAAHIRFQCERLAAIFEGKSAAGRVLSFYFSKLFFYATSLVVWMAHYRVFQAGGQGLAGYFKRIRYKFNKIIPPIMQANIRPSRARAGQA